jgi:type IX secretion system PorP/SprF family membrane protein
MKHIKIIILFAFGISQINKSIAQDSHFSQYYASPLTTNPALTGSFNGTYRISSNYRAQWNNLVSSGFMYQTPSVSIDVNFPKKNFAIGLVLLNDQTNNKTFNTLEAGLSFAYKIKTDGMILSFGVLGSYGQQYLDITKLSTTLQQTESNLNSSLQKIDVNLGVFTVVKLNPSARKENNTVFGGVALAHLLQPADNYKATTTGFKTPFKITAHGGFDLKINKYFRTIPGVFFAYQAGISQTNVGNMLQYNLKFNERREPTISLFAGVWSRINRATFQSLIPKVGIEVEKIRLGISYDYVMNEMSKNVMPSSFELSLNYIIKTNNSSRDFKCFSSPSF